MWTTKHEDRKVLFLDEIHRFNKAQQDFLLPYVESGELVLIGATTENPSFEVISPLLSRLRVFVLEELTDDQMAEIIGRTGYELDREAKEWLIQMANGDARQAITMIENTEHLYDEITLDSLKETLQSKFLRYDKKGEEHYNVISAFIKSMRASKPDAAMYYLARMIESGEDPKFIARRMVIFASEDVGLAQPTALVVANEVFPCGRNDRTAGMCIESGARCCLILQTRLRIEVRPMHSDKQWKMRRNSVICPCLCRSVMRRRN
jgi:putative ATPase